MRISLSKFAFVICLLLAASSTRADDKPAAASTAPKTLRVAAVQLRSSRNLAENIARTKESIARCAADGARVVVFPECSVTGYFDKAYMQAFTAEQLADAERQVAEACREHHVYAIVGMPYREGDKLYNSAIVITPEGKILERYHKVQLAESWPDGGDHLSVFKIDGVPCSIIVCHDERYPELVRLPVLAGSRVVFYLSHESSIDKETKLAPYRAQIQARAVENSVFVVQANAPANKDLTGSHGQSRIIAPDGNILHEASMFEEDIVSAALDVERATGKMASMSVTRGPLGNWWKEGVKRVRIIEEPFTSPKVLETAVQEVNFDRVFPAVMYQESHAEELKPYAEEISKLAKIMGIQAASRNPVCCVWLEISQWSPNPGQAGWIIINQPGGSIISASDGNQMKLAVEKFKATARRTKESIEVPRGLMTSYSVIR